MQMETLTRKSFLISNCTESSSNITRREAQIRGGTGRAINQTKKYLNRYSLVFLPNK